MMMRMLLTVALLLGSTAPALRAQAKLAPMDYIEIQELVAKYAYALDSGADNGYAYANLFTPDAVFVGMNQGEKGRSYQGREALAALARGGKRGPLYVSHFNTTVIIEPAAGGATGKVYVVIVEPGEAGKPGAITNGGHYQDSYVKTPAGWRFRQRVFYQSEVGPTPRQLKSPPADAPSAAPAGTAPSSAPAGTAPSSAPGATAPTAAPGGAR
jgi:hypothetical protein